MFTKNNPKEGFVNGTLGVVEAFDKIVVTQLLKLEVDGRSKLGRWIGQSMKTGKSKQVFLSYHFVWLRQSPSTKVRE
jgi:hypothetical protein